MVLRLTPWPDIAHQLCGAVAIGQLRKHVPSTPAPKTSFSTTATTMAGSRTAGRNAA